MKQNIRTFFIGTLRQGGYLLCILTALIFFPFVVNAQTRRALLVGISDYKSCPLNTGWNNLHGADDARMVNEALKKQGFDDIVILLDREATHHHIVYEFHQLAKRTKKGDTLFFLFSGHGQPFEDLDGDEGEEDGWDESLVPYDASTSYSKGEYEGEHHITDDQLYQFMLSLRRAAGAQGMVYLLLDACYSGSGMRGDEETESIPNVRPSILGFCINGYRPFIPLRTRQPYRRLDVIKDSAPLIALEASMPHQSNREIKIGDKAYGPLCYHVAEVLKMQDISNTQKWIREVIKNYRADKRLYRQLIFCEFTPPFDFDTL